MLRELAWKASSSSLGEMHANIDFLAVVVSDPDPDTLSFGL